MTSQEIRKAFVDYFSEHGHTHCPSASLIPKNDPTLLFTNAGMVPFKRVFLGEERLPFARAVSAQKCMRAGGKHNDLENVGQTARHHTFFEMLGNFSFGDYFKQEAIAHAWVLVTEIFKLPVHALWTTVYQDDNEAAQLWRRYLPKDRVIKLGESDNFWQMGETGPCGPCSEIFIDQGEELHSPCPGIGLCSCDRYLEIWNLVFMQHNRDASGMLSPLPKPSIDTGMGLERITAVRQGVTSNYETDLFRPVFQAIANLTQLSARHIQDSTAGRVIADHLRAITFLVADGVAPSNEGGGYLLRRILRRAARYGKTLGLKDPFLHILIPTVVEQMQPYYPELTRYPIAPVILREEEGFIHTLTQGMERLSEMIDQAKRLTTQILSGDALFRLYDTYGFPLDLATEIAREAGFQVDHAGFNAAMAVQKERARKAWVDHTHGAVTDGSQQDLSLAFTPSVFVGYETLIADVRVLGIVGAGALIPSAGAGEEVSLILQPTPFYAEAGGQVGDCGRLISLTTQVDIFQVRLSPSSVYLHQARVIEGTLTTGMAMVAEVNRTARRCTAKNHTATHLLHAALRASLGPQVKQAGSLVAPDRLRFDFQYFRALDRGQIAQIEATVNEKVLDGEPVQTQKMATQEAIESGAMALFDEKYGTDVRVVQVGDFSRELCGGTHCLNTGEIGLFKIVRETSVAAGIRRIEAITGPAALKWTNQRDVLLQEVAALLGGPSDEVVDRLKRLHGLVQEKNRIIEALRVEQTLPDGDIRRVGDIPFIAKKMPPADIREIRLQADRLKTRLKSGVVVVGACFPNSEKIVLVTMVTSDWSGHYPASGIVEQLARLIDGKGGGSDSLAQAGGQGKDRLDLAIAAVPDIIKNMVL